MKRSTVLITVLLVSAALARGQTSAPAGGGKPPLKPEELEQLLAPIALYPDSLLTQMLMASTYPLEIVAADRWVKAHKDLKGDALAKELETQDWDPSVKSMVNFPDQLAVMSEKLDTTMKLGDAFIGQQGDVLNTVQVLRSKADKQGNLKTNEQVKVTSAPTPAPAAGASKQATTVQSPPQVITIESANPTVVYVPTYNPTAVYGAWPYPPPPPYYPPRPPGYIAGAAISFGVGVACGAAWGYAWGNSDWGNNDVNINVNQNNNFNTNIDRSKYQANINNRQTSAGGQAGTWQHDPSHRQGVPYRDQASAQKYSGADQARAAQAREQFRGREEVSRQATAREQPAARPNNQSARTNQPANAPVQSRDRAEAGSGRTAGAFEAENRSGAETRAASQRGQASRSAGAARPAGRR